MLSLALLATPAFMNDGSGSLGVGGTVSLQKGTHKAIRLVDEEIRVKLPERRVRVTFRFRNEGPATRVTMAFPENGYLGGGATDKDLPKARRSNFGYFRTSVDGKPFVARLLKGKPTADGLAYDHWWVKEVPFARGQTRTVVNEYQGGATWGPPWSKLTGFSYVLRTGASWKGGRIGSTRVIVDARDVQQFGPVVFSPGQWQEKNGVYTWQRQNFHPEDDIHVSWIDGGFLDVYVDGESLALKWEAGEFASKKWPLPILMNDDVWMPADLAAGLVGASVRREGTSLRIEHPNGRTVDSIADAKGRVPFASTLKQLGGTAQWKQRRLMATKPK